MRSSNTSYLFQITDSSLTECLTKINRMDIVHLMESCVETSQDHGRTYAEIEQTIGLDHSEGKSEFSYVCTLFNNLLRGNICSVFGTIIQDHTAHNLLQLISLQAQHFSVEVL